MTKIVSILFNNSGFKVIDWVCQSPDINPVENLWRYLLIKLGEREINGEKMLKQCILEEWEKISKEFLLLQSITNVKWLLIIGEV